MATTLVTTRYSAPGAYIGRVQTPTPVGSNQSRTICLIGRGSRLQTIFDASRRRAYLEGVQLTFTTVTPYLAALTRSAVNDRTIARLYKANGMPVPLNKWAFGSTQNNGVYDQVLIYPEVFDPTATYYIDYQSNDRTLRDALPVSDLREMVSVGDVQGQNRYVENRDYYIPMQLVDPTNGADNSNQSAEYTAVVQTGVGPGTIVPDPTSTYTHKYTRLYTITIDSVAGDNVTITWTANTMSGQLAQDAIPDLPLVSGGTAPSMTVDVVASAGAPEPLLDLNNGATDTHGIELIFSQVAADFTPGDTYSFYAVAPQLLELDGAYNNTNQFAEYSPVTTDLQPLSTGGITVNSNSDFSLTTNRRYTFVITAVGGGGPGTRTCTVSWQGYGEGVPTYGSINVNEANAALPVTNRLVENGLRINLSFGATNFVASGGGDKFELTAYSPRLLPSHKDSRSYTLTVSACVAGTVSFAYVGTTVEAGAGTSTATGIAGLSTLPGAIRVYWRNLGDISLGAAAIDYTTSDEFTFTSAPEADTEGNSPLIDWTLRSELTETFTSSNILTDVVGLVTGVPSARYIVLQRAPSTTTYTEHRTVPGPLAPYTVTLTRSRLLGSGDAVEINIIRVSDGAIFTQVADGTAPGAMEFSVNPVTSVVTFNVAQTGTDVYISYAAAQIDHVVATTTNAEISFTALPNAQGTAYTSYLILPGYSPSTPTIEVEYVWQGIEPDPGNIYYVTADILRPDTMYNTPVTCYDSNTMRKLMGPMATDNDLMIGGIIAMEDNNAPSVMFIQVKDADGDGVHSATDFQAAITASETTGRLTDVIPLNAFSVLADVLNSNERMNDPFERKDRAAWIGTPIGTLIGDTDTADTKIFLATRTMQLFGENEARGTRILIGNSWVRKAIQLRDGSSVTVDLDGSFLAVAAAAQNAAFTDPATMLLRRNVSGFSFIDTYEESEELRLGGASILFCEDVGSGVYRWKESVTVDTSSSDNNEISAMNQRFFVTRDLRESMDANLVAYVPDSLETGIGAVVSFIATKLSDYVGRGLIAPYTDDSGGSRPIDPQTDIQVVRDTTDKLLYHFKYWYNIRYGIKRLFGLYSVDRRFWNRA
jgi:hypothetical protein